MSEDTTTRPPEAIGPSTADEAREAAIAWQLGFAGRTMSWGEYADETNYFADLAERFGLTEEFQENGII